MKVTNVQFYHAAPTDGMPERVKAYVTITFDDCFVVRNIRLVQMADGTMLVSMPSRKKPDGTHKDTAHAINRECRAMIDNAIFAEYERFCAKPETVKG